MAKMPLTSPLLSHIIYLMNCEPTGIKKKPRPKVSALEMHAEDVLTRYRQGQTLKEIMNWLKDSPRNVSITEQGVRGWVKNRLRKISKRAAEFSTSGIPASLQQKASCAPLLGSEKAKVAMPTTKSPTRQQGLGNPEPWITSKVKPDISEFFIDEAAAERAKNPLARKP